jgi:hypothetical protein
VGGPAAGAGCWGWLLGLAAGAAGRWSGGWGGGWAAAGLAAGRWSGCWGCWALEWRLGRRLGCRRVGCWALEWRLGLLGAGAAAGRCLGAWPAGPAAPPEPRLQPAGRPAPTLALALALTPSPARPPACPADQPAAKRVKTEGAQPMALDGAHANGTSPEPPAHGASASSAGAAERPRSGPMLSVGARSISAPAGSLDAAAAAAAGGDGLRRSRREAKQRVVYVNGTPVLKANMYDLESGEPSVFDKELAGARRRGGWCWGGAGGLREAGPGCCQGAGTAALPSRGCRCLPRRRAAPGRTSPLPRLCAPLPLPRRRRGLCAGRQPDSALQAARAARAAGGAPPRAPPRGPGVPEAHGAQLGHQGGDAGAARWSCRRLLGPPGLLGLPAAGAAESSAAVAGLLEDAAPPAPSSALRPRPPATDPPTHPPTRPTHLQSPRPPVLTRPPAQRYAALGARYLQQHMDKLQSFITRTAAANIAKLAHQVQPGWKAPEPIANQPAGGCGGGAGPPACLHGCPPACLRVPSAGLLQASRPRPAATPRRHPARRARPRPASSSQPLTTPLSLSHSHTRAPPASPPQPSTA